MRKLVTKGVSVSVQSSFRGTSGKKQQFKYIFDYKITIQNLNAYDVQIMNRYWFIFGSNLKISEINGEGVVGQTPKLEQNEQFTYSSCSFLTSEMGYMEGYYGVLNLEDNGVFEVDIPRFELIADWKLN
jgi:ApaG protein